MTFRPIAVWQYRGHFAVIDEQGRVIPRDDITAFAHLMVVVGEGAPNHVTSLLAFLDTEPDLRSQVTAAVWVGQRRWNLHLQGGLDVRLPERDPQAAWRRLGEYERRYGVLGKGLQGIDLRFSDRVIIRKPPPPP